jgi:hypothetical protein
LVRSGSRSAWALAAGLGWAAGTSALAEEKVVQEPDRTVIKKRTVIDFSEVAVEGELSRPEGSYSVSRRKTTFKTLVKVRESLAPELQKSAESL